MMRRAIANIVRAFNTLCAAIAEAESENRDLLNEGRRPED
jgi:hypothetical protein